MPPEETRRGGWNLFLVVHGDPGVARPRRSELRPPRYSGDVDRKARCGLPTNRSPGPYGPILREILCLATYRFPFQQFARQVSRYRRGFLDCLVSVAGRRGLTAIRVVGRLSSLTSLHTELLNSLGRPHIILTRNRNHKFLSIFQVRRRRARKSVKSDLCVPGGSEFSSAEGAVVSICLVLGIGNRKMRHEISGG
jgi:hypothetical protein